MRPTSGTVLCGQIDVASGHVDRQVDGGATLLWKARHVELVLHQLQLDRLLPYSLSEPSFLDGSSVEGIKWFAECPLLLEFWRFGSVALDSYLGGSLYANPIDPVRASRFFSICLDSSAVRGSRTVVRGISQAMAAGYGICSSRRDVSQGVADTAQGKAQPISEAFADVRKKLGISD